jgi:hypothetical protein
LGRFVKHEMIWAVLKSLGVDNKITRLLQNTYKNAKAAARVGKAELELWGFSDPLVILWGLLNAGLNRGSGAPFLITKPRRLL